jgi:hypothetical protein
MLMGDGKHEGTPAPLEPFPTPDPPHPDGGPPPGDGDHRDDGNRK